MRHQNRFLLFVAFVTLLWTLAGCGGPSPAASPTAAIQAPTAGETTVPTTAPTALATTAATAAATKAATTAATTAATAPAASAAAGEALFTQNGCASCHKADGTGVGPSFVGLYGKPVHLANGQTLTTDAAFLRKCILTPDQVRVANYSPQMPSFQGKLSDQQLTDLIAYIQSLGTKPPLTPISGAAPSGSPAAGSPTAAATGVVTSTAAPLVPGTETVVAGTETVEATEEPARPSNPGGPGAAVNLTGNATAGAQVYTASCAVCHGPQGKGGVQNPGSADGTVPPLNPIDPTIKSTNPKTFATNVDLFVEHGSRPEGANPSLTMPAWGDTKALTPQQIADVIAYIISLNQ
ncbi:MAG: c-type cytochrome [Chloroflexi bacterium]|nr:c-type cytochrome [Chloroflexota bacterium]